MQAAADATTNATATAAAVPIEDKTGTVPPLPRPPPTSNVTDLPPSYNEAIGQAANTLPNMSSPMPGQIPIPTPAPAPSHSSGDVQSTLNVVHVTTPLYGPYPIEMDCPFCQAHIVTSTERVAGMLPWIIMGVCFLLGFFLLIPWCVCCIPFYVDAFLDVVHLCPNCKRTLGRHNKL